MKNAQWFFSLILLSFFFPITVFAQQICQQEDPCAGKSLEEQVTCYESIKTACQSSRVTLSSQVNYMNNQIRLTTLRIDGTKTKITTLTNEINALGDEVNRLEEILNTRLMLLARRIPESYKRASQSQFGLLLFSRNFSDFISRVKYINTVQEYDAALVFQVKATQNSYNESKKVREDKKNQLQEIKIELESQNLLLSQQKLEKDALLSVTQGNESRYAQLLASAQAQVAAIRSFVSSLGGATILQNQTYHDDWGYYYNQRDAQWGYHSIGSSNETIANVGCLITSVSMVLTHYGKNVTPIDIASTLDAFVPGTAYMYFRAWSVGGGTVNRTSIGVSTGNIDGELSQGRPVIVGVYNGPGHFVVLKSGSNGNYTMNDPFVENGHDISFTSHYAVSDITQVDSVRVN